MKKPLLIAIVVLVIILALPCFSFLRWAFQEKKPMDIVILDKTVTNPERINHRSLSWILTNERFVKKSGGSYSFRKDYYGFYPKRPLRDRLYETKRLELSETLILADSLDGLYYADTYGVFMNDWYKGINKSRRSRKLYGGMTNNDYLLLNEMTKRNKLCILEYNTFDYPTADFDRYRTKNLLGIEVSGWTGKYFSTLDTAAKGNEDFPIWMTAMYRKQYRKPWEFNKAGIVFLKGSSILVLEEGTHLKNAIPFIKTDSVYNKKFGVVPSVGFSGWFDVIVPLKTKVISTYNIETTAAGDTLLFENFLSHQFPAVITDSATMRTWYFCGDFAANDIKNWTARFRGYSKLKGLLYSEKEDDMRRFFWLYYKPLVTGIFTDYMNSAKTK